MEKGKAYILGAGPGDFELLTLKAKRIIETADCIIYDRLINPKILGLVKKEAEKIYLGKENTEGGRIQEEINRNLIQKCLEGKKVARVKGGDSFVFGRGGEEILALAEQGIPFEVVPGITSSIAVPTYAGIPVTHRDIARSFHVFTGHTMEDGRWHDFENIAKLEGSLIFLMGVKNLERIVQDLLRYGKAPDTPVAIIEKGATEQQKVHIGILENIVKLSKEREVKAPAIIIIGEVVALHRRLQWFDTKKAKKILVTRDKKQASEMSDYIWDKGGIPVELPLITIEEQELNTAPLSKYSSILFNSPNGVNAFFRHIKDMRSLSKIKIGVVGVKTKEALEHYKVLPDFMPEEYLMDRLAEEAVKFTKEKENILIVSSDISPCEPEKYSSLYQRNYEKAVLYHTKKRKLAKEEMKKQLEHIDIITFLSSSAVEAFYENMEGDLEPILNKKIASIGPVTTASLQKLGMTVAYEAKTYTAKALIDTIFEDFK
ncbi:uroporphyrinogen-III C-methyltransferase [Fusobacterium necrophorum subsp. funduliforme ATCC 51357]|uniref:uroporphyrinogen-III C-methyltransferase n=1 Tax=Fusobacterium necrophorum subsp. funduliforme TaxID=143387 RepID=A0A162ILN1_9FUSO|nr:uroporphyrinogen-III C-methyltransferase [Fusobacterium necrophorum]AYV93660.1 uroporphyrinogen-III C-methyltransferase [Fusobacterium necrophorum subsp. funduliforme]EIJ70379.1 uroporphyrinogen-III C-methyltransferase [Fusobacterium necrophorum subsp. funduliforme ATCC 51357]KAB0552021.1 uroporphyrinogen-III C-methyltransferase [Fusobacterium necrophorum subsp. funduliforme]KYL01873.1 uroporphyrinogen-III synthase [Fusobacterium necrophorum subsp. funduliforme]KYM42627.1 uroporphyrinogen-I